MNIKLRFENPATCVALVVAVIALVYEILAVCGITPWITQDQAVNIATQVVTILFTILVGLGIVTDPTTSGVLDSDQAMAYDWPREPDEEIDMSQAAESEGDDDGQGD